MCVSEIQNTVLCLIILSVHLSLSLSGSLWHICFCWVYVLLYASSVSASRPFRLLFVYITYVEVTINIIAFITVPFCYASLCAAAFSLLSVLLESSTCLYSLSSPVSSTFYCFVVVKRDYKMQRSACGSSVLLIYLFIHSFLVFFKISLR